MSFSGNEGRFHFIVEEAVSGEILTRDLVVQEPKLLRAVSGAANIQFKVNAKDYSVAGIYFKPWGHWIHAEKTILGQRKIWASALVVPSQIDKKTGIMNLEAHGFSGYMKKMPMLFNWNPLANDAFEPVHRIWAHLQSFETGNLGVEVYPALSGIEMLPGYAFDGQLANLNFFATFVRAEDRADSADWVDKLARDIPFDYVEQSGWNVDRTAIWKKLFLGYPKAGVQQDNLAFVIGENVIEAAPHIETEIDWVSDVIVSGWFPGQQHSNHLTNADPNRFRRVTMDDDARINSDERAAAWARRKLTRRQTPAYWESIVIDPGHSNAPFGSFDVGDRIWVSGRMPWVGDVRQLHKVIAIEYEEKSQTCQVALRAEGAFNYDPIYFQGSANAKTIVVPAPIPVTMGVGTPTLTGP